ncbi:hypothetical protein [Flavobacterium nackdongense]|uniref:Lipoprotein n=1 Tax=Flavobacterium nackdongense TaxID=2547394 RepID=A0A4P6YB89_9FLAO|nr:hypothetical protein [Flavobacterium nackdongense]QBN20431.1 hypothetical protein E1750_17085 [Flavobacterium nackdongense]
MMQNSLKITVLLLLFLGSCKDKQDSTQPLENKEAPTEIKENLASQDENFKVVADSVVTRLNREIIEENIKTESEIMGLYKPKDIYAEGNYSYEIETKEIDANKKQLTLIEEGLMDDALKAQKVVMVLENASNGKKIISIKEAYKCWRNPNNENWTTALCK